jgi:hypothetical protein
MHVSELWEQFIEEIPWLLDPGEKPEVGATQPPGSWLPQSVEFVGRFPELARVLQMAHVTPISRSGSRYLLYSWPCRPRSSRSWLSPVPSPAPPSSLHSDHQLVLASFGGIIERSHEPDWWLLNHDDVLTEREAAQDGNFIRDYVVSDEWPAGIPIAPEQFYSIAREANGNTTLCHRASGEVVLFAPDHAFEHVEVYPGCPEYSLYLLAGAPTFAAWVNTIARQWLETIEEIT